MKITSVDNSLQNSDWLKNARIDIPGIRYFSQLIEHVGINPVSDYESLVEFHSGHPWLSNVFPETELFMEMYRVENEERKARKK